MLTVIIPALNEERFLNRTIQNIYDTCSIEPEVIVIDQGGNGEIDPRVKAIPLDQNMGERVPMNLAAQEAANPFLLRIDAHCDFSPQGWDVLMAQVTGEKDITVAVLTAVYHSATADAHLQAKAKNLGWQDWTRVPGHWYGFSRLLVNDQNGLEAKWQKPNQDHSVYSNVEPNMGLTGCGFMIRKAFYEQIGGADEDLPKMGAIGEEFAIKAWHHGGKVQTRTDVMIGHIFGTGGYNTHGVLEAQQKLNKRYGACLDDVWDKFPDWETIKLVTAKQPGKPVRTVTVHREDRTNTTDENTGEILRTKVEFFRYVWLANEHPGEEGWTDKQIEEKYAPLAVKVGEEMEYPNVEKKLDNRVIVP